MKKISVICLIAILSSGCNADRELDSLRREAVFIASFENLPDTKVYADSDLELRWNAGDKISIFTSTLNTPYIFCGETGDKSGEFTRVISNVSDTEGDVSRVYAVYPYDENTSLTGEEKIKINLPAIQHYNQGSFGSGAGAMVAVTSSPSDNYLSFKNICSYLVVKVYGEGIVKSISISGNNAEKLAGPAIVTAAYDKAPTLSFEEDATSTVTLDCGEGVTLGPDAEHATEFWFCLPPVTFSKGFSVKAVNDKNAVFQMTSALERNFSRNHKASMAAQSAVFKKRMPPAEQGYITSGKYRNYLEEFGYTKEEIKGKIDEIYYRIFEQKDSSAYRDVVVDGVKMGYVSDVKNGDVRSEGMSYGMMVAVQLDKPELFNKIWRWANKYMRSTSKYRKGMFAWQVNTDGSSMGWLGETGSASDGELFFVTDLLLASRRWGSYEEFNYLSEAKTLLDQLFSKDGSGNVTNIINMDYMLINFCPDNSSNLYTDPSYHLPAFYEIWAETAGDGREDIYRTLAVKAREFLHKAANATTGLTPDYSEFDGTPRGSYDGHDQFHYDAWRVPMNIAMDFTWYHKDAQWQSDYAKRIQECIIGRYGLTTFPDQFALDGGAPAKVYSSLRHSIGLVGTLATTSLMIDDTYSQDLVKHMFEQKLKPYDEESRYYDVYYDGLLYLFALLHLSGNYRMSW